MVENDQREAGLAQDVGQFAIGQWGPEVKFSFERSGAGDGLRRSDAPLPTGPELMTVADEALESLNHGSRVGADKQDFLRRRSADGKGPGGAEALVMMN